MELAFNEDQFIQARVKELIQKHKISVAVETGTYEGDTTLFLAKLVPQVFTIELDPTKLQIANQKFKAQNIYNNIGTQQGKSSESLDDLLPKFRQGKVFFYLDAHVPENPLLDELAVIAKHCPDRAVIVIHDFKVPDKPYISYQELSIEYISDLLPKLYPKGWDHSYNDEVGKQNIGCVFIEPIV